MTQGSADFEVATLGLGIGRARNRLPDLVTNLVNMIQHASTFPEEQRVLQLVRRAVSRTPLDEGQIRQLGSALQAPLGVAIPAGDNDVPGATLDVLYALTRLAAAQNAPDALQPAANSIALERPRLIANAASAEPPAEPLRGLLISAVTPVLSPTYGADRMVDAADALMALDPSNGEERVVAQLTQAVDQAQLAEIPAVVTEIRGRVSSAGAAVVAALLARIRAIPVPARAPFFAALTALEQMAESEHREAFADLLAQMLASTDPQEVQAGVAFAASGESKPWGSEIALALERVAASVASAGYDPARKGMFSLAASRWGQIDSGARGMFISTVSSWIRDNPGYAVAILEPFAGFDGVAEERRALVEATLEVEPRVPPHERSRLLFLAWQLRGREGSVAGKRLQQRFDELRQSQQPFDVQTWQQLASQIGAEP